VRSRSCSLALVVLASFGASAALWAAAPPARLTAVQQQRLQESARLLRQANPLFKQGKTQETIEAIRQGLALERAVLGQVRPSRCDRLSSLATLLEGQEQWQEAARARGEVVEVRHASLGKDHWRAIDARWQLRDGERLARLTPSQRGKLAQASRLNSEAFRLNQQGKAALALSPARQELKLRQEVLGQKHPDYANSLNAQAVLHQAMRDHQAALPLYQQALKLLVRERQAKRPV
jgi:tetratricopeptide (TPR) repeat protein